MSKKSKELKFITNVAKFLHNNNLEHYVDWTINDKGKLRPFVRCNDIFVHGSDGEEITKRNLELLIESRQELLNLKQQIHTYILFVAKSRNHPLPLLVTLPTEIAHLFPKGKINFGQDFQKVKLMNKIENLTEFKDELLGG